MSLKYLSTNITSDQYFWTGMIAGIAGFCPKVIDIFIPINEYAIYFGIVSNFIAFHLCMFLSYRTFALEQKAKRIKNFRRKLIPILENRARLTQSCSWLSLGRVITEDIPTLRAEAVRMRDKEAIVLLDKIKSRLTIKYLNDE